MGFTVQTPTDNTDPRIFQTSVYNSGSGFNMATGKFVCQHPGMYLFTATIIRKDGTYEVRCYIYHNKTTKLRVFANNNNSDAGFPSGSGTIVIHLTMGDEVYLGGCSGDYVWLGRSHTT